MQWIKYIVAIGLFCSGGINTLDGQTTWQKQIDQILLDEATKGLVVGPDESFYSVRGLQDGNLGPVVRVLEKWSFSGELQWGRRYEDGDDDIFEGPLLALPDGDLLVSMVYYTSSDHHFWVVERRTTEGNLIWSDSFPLKLILDIDYHFAFYDAIAVDTDDIRLYFRMFNWEPMDSSRVKNGYLILDRSGKETFRTYFDRPDVYEWPLDVVYRPGEGFLRMYRPNQSGLFARNWYDFLDMRDSLIWRYEVGPIDNGGAFGLACVDSTSNYYFLWLYDTSGQNQYFDLLPTITSLDPEGNLRWQRGFGETWGNLLVLYDIICMPDGRIVACGFEGNTQLSGGNYRTGWIVCVDKDGNKLWERRYVLDEAREAGNYFWKMIPAPDGGLILSGELYPKAGGSDVWLMRTDAEGCLQPGCGLYNFISIHTTKIFQAGPEKKMHLISYPDRLLLIWHGNVPETPLTYSIYNMEGRCVLSGNFTSPELEIDVADLPSGIYLVHTLHPDFIQSGVYKFFKP